MFFICFIEQIIILNVIDTKIIVKISNIVVAKINIKFIKKLFAKVVVKFITFHL